MSGISRYFTKRVLAYLAVTSALVGISFFVSQMLMVVFGYASPVALEFHTNHQYAVDDVRIDELQRRIDALVASVPALRQARLTEQTQIPDGCDAPGLSLDVSMRTMWYSGSDIHHDLVGKAGEVGLGRQCGSFGISLVPSRNGLYVQSVLALGVLLLIWRSRRGRSTFGVNWSDWNPLLGWAGAVRWGILGGIVAVILVVAMTWLLSAMGVEDDSSSYWAELANQQWFALLPLAVVAAPIYEEFFYRAWLMERLSRVFPAVVALSISAVGFAVFHLPQNAMQWSQLLLGGLILGAIWWRTRSLTACVLAHATWNAFAFAMFWFGIDV